ncbi:hypothetical protein VY88_20765 [Azospirillum thiophilum]|uniref:Uncharacterized protein n=1 Tax=Azospirillum thiophilum TaxID=528244 RepID=A0AAC8W371_9PROT|nr:hypothetical protein [Azospirillum thiophilum]ALG74263.1 hypothetical protein AL072_25205 [Azospirillum thiophilum]KJR63867.1 hypothetical protein VY88_20765 [Azospirillum thiophilum]
MLGKSARTLARRRVATETHLAETAAGTVPSAGALLGEAAAILAVCLSVALVLALLGNHLAGG